MAIFKSRLLLFGSIYFFETSHICSVVLFKVITNLSARICLNIFKDSLMQSSKSGETRKSGRKNLRIYSWYSLSDLKQQQKRFIRIPS